MASQIITHQSLVIQLQKQIEYPSAGILSKIIFQDQACQYTLFCLAGNSEISEHTSPRNATINVLDGRGVLTLSGEDIVLETGVFVLMSANVPHAVKAEENLTFLLTLSEKVKDSE